MLIGLISDIHNHVSSLEQALDQLKTAGCTHLLCLGDITTEETLLSLINAWPGELHLVLGNCDYPREGHARLAAMWPNVQHHGTTADIQLGGRRIFMAHDPGLALRAASIEPGFDAVFYGHTHVAEQRMNGAVLEANPGDLQGRFTTPHYAVYDTATHRLTHYSLPR